MSLAISLNPVSKALHMYGTAHTSCSYSLSGSVHLTLSRPPTLFPSAILRPRSSHSRSNSGTTSVILTSLIMTFEGKAEHHQDGGVYSAARLCTISQQLITSPISLQLNDDNQQQHATHYDLIFDLTIPGWLPSTFTGADNTNNAISSTSYSLFATATYHVDTPPSYGPSQSLTSTFCNLMQNCNPLSGWSRADRKSHADRVEIKVIRHLVSTPPPPPTDPTKERNSVFPPTSFTISAQAKSSSPIPNDIISRLQIVASIPGFVATNESSIPISLKARFKNANDAPEKFAIERVEIDLDQNEMYHAQPDDQYTSRFALPSEQPPTHPLLHRSTFDHFEHLGLILRDSMPKKWIKTHSILDEKAPSSFFLDSQDGKTTGATTEEEQDEERPYVLGTDWSVIKMAATLRESGQGMSPTYLSPFLRVTHTLNVALYVNYGDNKKDVVSFPLPINFVVLPPSTTSPSQRALSPNRAANRTSRIYEPLLLPAYTQLFHEDGEVRVDMSRGVPPAYRDKLEGEEEYGRTVKQPELVPVGTTEVDWETVRGLLA